MSNGEDREVATQGNKMAAISKKINYVIEASKKNLNLSGEIRAKLLSTDAKAKEEYPDAEKTPREAGQLNSIVDNLQDILNVINSSNAHLVSVNKEI